VSDEDHGRIEELLAGYALRSLEGSDAADADRLLADHVPACAGCRQTLDAFVAIAGDLALDAPVLPPPRRSCRGCSASSSHGFAASSRSGWSPWPRAWRSSW
jgi:hypothetical protein